MIIVIMQDASISATEDDAFLDLYGSQTKNNMHLSLQNPNLLGINQLLESVCYLLYVMLLH